MTTVEIPYSIAAVLPTLTVMDITNDLSHELRQSGCTNGIAYITSGPGPSLVRINERESGFFEDLEGLLERLVPLADGDRERMVQMLLASPDDWTPTTACSG